MSADRTRFEYRGPTLHHGPGCVEGLDDELARLDRERALIVTGRTVGGNDEVMEPIRAGLGDRLVEEFSDVTPAKTLGTAASAADIVRDADIDVVIGVGGGGTLDTTKQVSLLSAFADPMEAARSMIEQGTIDVPDEPLTDIVAIPTTLPGADLSFGAGVGMSMDTEATSKSAVPSGGISDTRLMPAAVWYDAELVATTPPTIRCRSAMNGFDKGIEAIYSRHHTPVTDATASRGLRLLQSSLPVLRDSNPPMDRLSTVLEGIALVQYGIASPGVYRASIIHAFGHALTEQYPIQQGVAHAIAAPHVLRYLFERIDGRRAVLAAALGVTDTDDDAAAVVTAVEETRDALGLPSRLQSVADADRSDASDLATAVLDDSIMDGAPAGLSPKQAEIGDVFTSMW